MIVLIDNFDSFTHNLYQLITQIEKDVKVIRNNEMTIDELKELNPTRIILSPGPGHPADAGICIEVIREFASEIPILGICLGHQAIGEAFGAQVIGAGEIMHGKPSSIYHKERGLFQGLPLPFDAGRYHSLVVDKESLPADLIIEAETEQGMIMGLKHAKYPCYGLQFHPESILTPLGAQLIKNFFLL